jgi:hypothetical protein
MLVQWEASSTWSIKKRKSQNQPKWALTANKKFSMDQKFKIREPAGQVRVVNSVRCAKSRVITVHWLSGSVVQISVGSRPERYGQFGLDHVRRVMQWSGTTNEFKRVDNNSELELDNTQVDFRIKLSTRIQLVHNSNQLITHKWDRNFTNH